MRPRMLGLAALAASLFALPVLAHHSFAMFDQSKEIRVTGTVKELELVNPHGWLHVMVANEAGQAALWSFEGGSVAQLKSLGWSEEAFRPGDKVEVVFRPMKDGSRGGRLMSATVEGGKKVCSNRGCGDGTGTVLPAF